MLDPDSIARGLQAASSEGGSPIDAGREVLRLADQYLANRESFLAETTLSGTTYIRMMRRAKELGYLVVLFFVGTNRVEINFDRVRQRVVRGGHDVPEEDQRRRFPRSMTNMRVAFEVADEAVLWDNSGERHLRLAVKDANGVKIYRDLPEWAAFLRPN